MSSQESISVTPHGDYASLLEGLLKIFESHRRGLEPLRLVVPSVHLRNWLQIQIARRLGLCMGFEFSMLKEFMVGGIRMKSSIIVQQ